MEPPSLNCLSLCSGIAGLDLGVKIACPRARTICYVERDPYCQRVLMARMSDGSIDAAPIHRDLTTFDGRPWRGVVDCVIAGFPCQDISNAGRREGIVAGNRSGLWFEVERVVCEVGPRLVFLENVSALLNRGLDTVLRGLAELRFDVEWGVFSAADVGAPHLRKRVFILAESQNLRHERRGAARGRGNGPADGNGSLADAQRSERRPHALSRGDSGEGIDGAGEEAGRAGECRRLLADAAVRRPRGPGLGVKSGQSRSAISGDYLGHASGAGLEERGRQRGDPDEELAATERAGGLPLFPPGPADRDGWAAVLRERPDLTPAVERGVRPVDDGLSNRVAQLKACGNAVVPLAAALAFTELARRLGG